MATAGLHFRDDPRLIADATFRPIDNKEDVTTGDVS